MHAGADGRRKVAVWDDFTVSGNATVNGKICNSSGKCLNSKLLT